MEQTPSRETSKVSSSQVPCILWNSKFYSRGNGARHWSCPEPDKYIRHFRFLWPCIVSKLWSEIENQQDATARCLLSILSQHLHPPPIKQAQRMHQNSHSRYTRPEEPTRQTPVQHHDTPICTRHSHIHTRSQIGLLHTTPHKRHYS